MERATSTLLRQFPLSLTLKANRTLSELKDIRGSDLMDNCLWLHKDNFFLAIKVGFLLGLKNNSLPVPRGDYTRELKDRKVSDLRDNFPKEVKIS